MDSKENHATSVERSPLLNCELPKVLIEGQHDALFGFGKVQKGGVFPSSAITAGPKDVVTANAKWAGHISIIAPDGIQMLAGRKS